VKWNLDLTPYIEGIQDTSDIPLVQVVAVKGPARSGKTVAAENRALKHWIYGPSVNVLWYMQSREDVEDYVEERVEWMLEHHEQVSAKIKWNDRRNSRARKRIGTTLARWLPATKGTTRGKAAPLIIADEIDGYAKAVRRSILTRLINRQREFGTGALAYICSHPDEGPTEGIDAVLRDSLVHLWFWECQACGFYSSPSPEAEHRMRWNVPELIAGNADLERGALLDKVEEGAALICPHCESHVRDDPAGYLGSERDAMNRTGRWLQPHQTIGPGGEIDGAPEVQEYMGFCIHGFMSPFVTIGGLAREWAAAKLESDLTGNETGLKEVVVKSLGETFIGSQAEKQIEDWKVVGARLKDQPYLMGTVPAGCQFLTAFVDIQGDRFEVRVIGWNVNRESWLVDAYAIKQAPPDPETGKPAFDNLDPFHRLNDWSVLEDGVLRQTYPLADHASLHLPIARMVVDTGGGDDTTNNARKWAAGSIGRARNPVPAWRILLTKGAASKKSETYGKPRKLEYDDQGKPLPAAVWERTVNVHEIKGILALRMKIEVPGPGRMHMPIDVKDRIVRELCAEQFVNGEWIAVQRANETWDGWVAAEVARETLQPERTPPIDWQNAPPPWAKPFEIGKERGIDTSSRPRPGYWERLRKINRGAQTEE
jgi:phage terminase large subunit GpA-like protein